MTDNTYDVVVVGAGMAGLNAARSLAEAGPKFKAMLEAAEDAQLEGHVTTTEEGMAVVRERFGAPSA